jgi:hypothetical protein
MELHSEKLKTTIENAVKVVGLIGVLFYLTGFIITSFYYGYYKVLAIDFVSLKYMLVGGFFYFLLLCTFGLYAFIYLGNKLGSYILKRDKIVSKIKRRIIRVLFTGTFVFMWSSLIFLFFIAIFNGDILNNAHYTVYLYFLLMVICFCGLMVSLQNNLKSTNNIEDDEDDEDLPNIVIPYVVSFSSIIMFGLLLFAYTFTVYNNIPESLGGGKFSQISFLIKDSETTRWMNIVLPLNDTISKSSHLLKYNLIKESSDAYYVLGKSTPIRVIFIPKRIIQAAIISDN